VSIYGGISALYSSIQAVYRHYTGTQHRANSLFPVFDPHIWGVAVKDETPFALAVSDDLKGNDL